MASVSSSQMEFDLLGIGTVLKRHRLVVPLNQREYSWDEENVQELFQDISEAITSGKREYFLGVIVLTTGADGNLEIADGQQRLATTTILLAAMRDYFHHRQDRDMIGDISDFLRTFVRGTREHNPRLSMNVTDHDFFSKRTLELPDSDLRQNATATQPSHKLLNRAAELAEEHVQNIVNHPIGTDGDDYLNTWLDFIERSAQVIVLKTPDDMNAYVMFETLNDRGARVSQSDLVKNYLFSESRNRINEAQDRWALMNGSLDQLGDNDATIDFLRHLVISLYGPVRERAVLERIRSNIKGQNSAINFLDTLSTAAGDYVALQSPLDTKWTSHSSKMRHYIIDTLSLRVIPLRPLMLAVIRSFESEQMEEAFRLFVSWSVRLSVVGGARSGRYEIAFGNAAQKVSNQKIQTAEALTSELMHVLPNDSTFESEFRTFSVSISQQARYYLRTLEVTAQNKSELEWVPNTDTVITLEHIMPQRLGDKWDYIDPSIHSTYFKRLGNMALLTGSLNRNLRNNSFDEKRKVYETSEYLLTHEIAEEQTWGPAEIEKRQRRLSELAVRAWPMT